MSIDSPLISVLWTSFNKLKTVNPASLVNESEYIIIFRSLQHKSLCTLSDKMKFLKTHENLQFLAIQTCGLCSYWIHDIQNYKHIKFASNKLRMWSTWERLKLFPSQKKIRTTYLMLPFDRQDRLKIEFLFEKQVWHLSFDGCLKFKLSFVENTL